jgi:hypothetical protein
VERGHDDATRTGAAHPCPIAFDVGARTYASRMARKIPRPFTYSWGSGQIVEEVSAIREHSEPTLQLLEFQDEGHAGYEMIRFCSYTPSGAFRRHPMLAGSGDIQQLRAGLKEAPRLRALLARLVEDD